MNVYGKGTNCDKLWRAWNTILISILHVFLFYVGINRYLLFKEHAFDAKFGGNWNQAGMNFTLAMLICAMTCFIFFLFTNFIRTENYANEGTQIGRDTDNLHLLVSSHSWRPNVQTMNGNNTSTYNYVHVPGATNGNGGGPNMLNAASIQRSTFPLLNGESEEDRGSAMAGDDAIPIINLDSWSRRSGANQDMLNPYTSLPTKRLLHRDSNSLRYSMISSTRILWQRFCRHFLPYSNILHVLMAYFLLLPVVVVHAQEICHRALPDGWIWRSDLDFLFGFRFQKVQTPLNSELDTKSVQGLNEFGRIDSHALFWDNSRAVSPEYFNLALSLLLLCLRYPSVFWYTNRAFSFVFSSLLFLTGLHALIEFDSACILMKLATNAPTLKEQGWPLNLVFASTPIMPAKEPSRESILQPKDHNSDTLYVFDNFGVIKYMGPILLSTLGTITFLIIFLSVFEYGYNQFTDNLAAYRHYLVGSPNASNEVYTVNDNVEQRSSCMLNGINHSSTTAVYNHTNSDSVHSGPTGISKSNVCTNGSILNDVGGQRNNRYYSIGAEKLHMGCRFCLHAYAPHTSAIIGCFVVLAFKIPLLWDCIQVYRIKGHPLMLLSPISTVILACSWLIVWFAFSLKPAWKFQVHLPLQPAVSAPILPVGNPFPQIVPFMNGMYPFDNTHSLLRNSAANSALNGRHSAMAYIPPVASVMQQSTSNGFVSPSNCYIAPMDDFALAQGTSNQQASPIYACYHDQINGYCTGAVNLSGGLVRPATVGLTTSHVSGHPRSLSPVPTSCDGLVGNPSRSVEYYGEDAEASSGRQSGVNNYVCLQNFAGNMPTNQNAFMSSNETSGTLSRNRLILQPSVSSDVIMTIEGTISSTLPRTHLSHTSGSSQLPKSLDPTLSSPSSAGPGTTEEDDGSTHTVQLNNTSRQYGNFLPAFPKAIYSNQSIPPYSNTLPAHPGARALETRDRASETLNSVSTTDKTHGLSMIPSVNALSNTGKNCSSTAVLKLENLSGRLLPKQNSTVSPQMTVDTGNNITGGHRVTFRDNVDMITNGSPSTSDEPGSQNTSSNDSGIDTVKHEMHRNLEARQNNSSGSYDNAFPTTFRSSVVIRSPSQTRDDMSRESNGILFAHNSPDVSLVLARDSALHSRNQHDANHNALTTVTNDHLAVHRGSVRIDNSGSVLNAPVSSSTTNDHSRENSRETIESMIGDTSTSYTSNQEQLALLLSSCLLTDDPSEPRLCSQV